MSLKSQAHVLGDLFGHLVLFLSCPARQLDWDAFLVQVAVSLKISPCSPVQILDEAFNLAQWQLDDAAMSWKIWIVVLIVLFFVFEDSSVEFEFHGLLRGNGVVLFKRFYV